MWELLTGEEPYADMHCGAIIGKNMSTILYLKESYILYQTKEILRKEWSIIEKIEMLLL